MKILMLAAVLALAACGTLADADTPPPAPYQVHTCDAHGGVVAFERETYYGTGHGDHPAAIVCVDHTAWVVYRTR